MRVYRWFQRSKLDICSCQIWALLIHCLISHTKKWNWNPWRGFRLFLALDMFLLVSCARRVTQYLRCSIFLSSPAICWENLFRYPGWHGNRLIYPRTTHFFLHAQDRGLWSSRHVKLLRMCTVSELETRKYLLPGTSNMRNTPGVANCWGDIVQFFVTWRYAQIGDFKATTHQRTLFLRSITSIRHSPSHSSILNRNEF